ncbi:MAG: hypothetical protein ACREQ5_10180 [Candidatus Dormibacteria bacterium]
MAIMNAYPNVVSKLGVSFGGLSAASVSRNSDAFRLMSPLVSQLPYWPYFCHQYRKEYLGGNPNLPGDVLQQSGYHLIYQPGLQGYINPGKSNYGGWWEQNAEYKNWNMSELWALLQAGYPLKSGAFSASGQTAPALGSPLGGYANVDGRVFNQPVPWRIPNIVNMISGRGGAGGGRGRNGKQNWRGGAI